RQADRLDFGLRDPHRVATGGNRSAHAVRSVRRFPVQRLGPDRSRNPILVLHCRLQDRTPHTIRGNEIGITQARLIDVPRTRGLVARIHIHTQQHRAQDRNRRRSQHGTAARTDHGDSHRPPSLRGERDAATRAVIVSGRPGHVSAAPRQQDHIQINRPTTQIRLAAGRDERPVFLLDRVLAGGRNIRKHRADARTRRTPAG
ncbi:MAG: hypothetical protein JWP89_2271, partial [Schlesneria sp.]|nr:hypothetical protein [Schlesneria sp.]